MLFVSDRPCCLECYVCAHLLSCAAVRGKESKRREMERERERVKEGVNSPVAVRCSRVDSS